MNDVIVKQILLKTPQDVKAFCYAMSEFPRNVNVKVQHDTYVVDGKSILGMFSLNLSDPVTVVIESKDLLNSDEVDKIFYPWEV